MRVDLAYYGRSGLKDNVLGLAPNLCREAVAFDGVLKDPVRFREAISALHEVVVSDLRFKRRDKAAYEEWKRGERGRLRVVRREAVAQARLDNDEKYGVSRDLRHRYTAARKTYWKARRSYANYLLRHDRALWRKLMPCDPVVTVAPDVVFFECFSADESSYASLTVDASGFGNAGGMQPGTTNVDYSWELFDGFSALRSYRETRLLVDPTGFEARTRDASAVREEEIDLPDGWLRGFMQLQSAMTLPMRRVPLSRETVYGILAVLKRRRAKESPRALRFELVPGEPPAVVLEPWEQRIVSEQTRYDGPGGAPVRIWGRRRLLVLARLLPLMDRCDVYLLGDGLPSFWVAHMGDMRFTLGLSGWTTNDWTRGSALDLLAPPVEPSPEVMNRVAEFLQRERAATLDEVRVQCLCGEDLATAALNRLAHTGQVIGDLAAQTYRWRQIMPRAVGESEMGPESPELVAARVLFASGAVRISRRETLEDGRTLVIGRVKKYEVEVLLDRDGVIKRAKSTDRHHHRFGLRAGPSRYILAVRMAAQNEPTAKSGVSAWYRKLRGWTQKL